MKFWKTKFGRYIYNNLIAWDQTWNARTGGDPDETISSRIGKIKRNHAGKIPFNRHPLAWVIDSGLEAIQKDHCINSIEEDEGKDSVIPDES